MQNKSLNKTRRNLFKSASIGAGIVALGGAFSLVNAKDTKAHAYQQHPVKTGTKPFLKVIKLLTVRLLFITALESRL